MIQTTSSGALRDSSIKQELDTSFYHSQSWLDLLSDTYKCSTVTLTTADDAGHITGFLPLCLLRSPLIGRRLVSLPFSDSCSLLAKDEVSSTNLVNQAMSLAQEQKVRYLELRTGINKTLVEHPDLVPSNLYVRWLLPLAIDSQSLWSGLRKPIQRQIKKSKSLGVQVRIAQHRGDMIHYYRLHLRTRMKHGMPAQPQRFFFGLWDTFADKGLIQLLLAEYQGMIIAAMILIASDTTLRYAYGASDENYLHLAPNNLLLWTAIDWGCAQGYQMLDLGRTSRDNDGLMEFKRRWGAIEEPLPYYYYPHSVGLTTTSEKSWQFRVLTTFWKRLPLSIAGPLGGSLYKHLG